MSAPGIVFSLPEATVSFDSAGSLIGVRTHDRNDDGYLAPGLAPERLTIGGSDGGWINTGCIADVDEIEISYRSIDHPHLTAVVRHMLSVVWGTRVVLSNTGPDPLTIDRVSLGLRAAPGYHGWALPAGATAAYTLWPESGAGPLLGWSLQHGEISAMDRDGIHCDQVRIEAGSRYVVQFLWTFHDQPVHVHRTRSYLVPEQLCLTVGDPIEIADEDTALVAPEAVEITTIDGVRELTSEVPGHYPIELRSGRGTTRFGIQWVPPAGQVLAAAADRLLEGSRTAAGVPRIRTGHQAILVQHGLAEMLIMDPELGSDALELYSSQLLEREDLAPVDVAFLCGEWTRTGDTDLLDAAVEAVLQVRTSQPGLGLASTRLCVSLMMAGRPVDRVLAALAGVRNERAGTDVTSLLAELELILVMLNNISEPGPEVLNRVERLGSHLGYGLPGAALEPIDVDTLGYLISVLGLLPDRAGEPFLRSWGTTPQALADRCRPTVLSDRSELGDRGLAWLVLGRLSG